MKAALVLSCLALASIATVQAEDAPAAAVSPWKTEAELGYVQTSGNTKVQAINVKEATTLKQDANSYSFFAGYLYSKANGTNTAKNWNLGVKYDRALTDHFSLFIGQKVEGDKFQSIKQRYSTDIGAKRYLVKEETAYFFSELGYRFTRENQTTVQKTYHFARAYMETEKKWNPSVSTKLWLEYLPNFTDTDDYLANGEASVSAALTNVFSLKTAYLVKYDNKPATSSLKKTDSVFTTNLVAKF